METNARQHVEDESDSQAAILGALVGACLGAADAERTAGRPRSALVSDAVAVPSGGVPLPALPLFGEGERTWVAAAVRHGLARRCDPMAEFVAGLRSGDQDRLTASASACVAAAVSAAVEGCEFRVVLSLAVMAADMASDGVPDSPGPDLGARLQWATAVASRAEDDPDDVIDLLVGTTGVVQECVPAAFAFLGAHPVGDRPDVAALCARAAALGGASDVIAVIVGAVAGASAGLDGLSETTTGSWPALRPLSAELAASRL